MSSTDILSKSFLNSGQLSRLDSGWMYAENSGASYRASLFTMNEFGAYHGAMLTLPNTYGLAFISDITSWAVEWDTGSFTRTDTTVGFWIPPKINKAQIGLNFKVSSRGTTQMGLRVQRSGNRDWPRGTGEDYWVLVNTGAYGSHMANFSAIFPVNSGDRITITWYTTGSMWIHPSTTNCFWIRGFFS